MRFEKRMHYLEDVQLFRYRSDMAWYILLLLLLLAAPAAMGTYWVSLLIQIGIYIIVALGLNLLSGYTGQVSLGHAAFFAVGAYTSAILTGKYSIPFLLALPASGVAGAAAGLVVGLPALRLKGLYLAIATMGFGFIVEEIIVQWESVTNSVNGLMVTRPVIGPISFQSDKSYYYLVLAVVLIMVLAIKNILRTPTGRAFIAIRDSEIAAESMGVSLTVYKTAAFAISAFYAGVAGSLFAHFMFFIGPENFTIMESISFLVMILVGGLGSVHGAVFGAVFITFLPEAISLSRGYLPAVIGEQAGLQSAVYGLVLLLFIRFEPLGLYGRWLKVKFYFENFPFYKKDTFRRVRKFHRTVKQ
ncbi:branched-chain amino acid transport system permease protein [Desulfatibacillum alkenivorans DSM 16219]|jgi:branched-chain amino acid transport system permease protein|uniref:Branched-chain amino acid transport system permease protein n=1 Tax=Desulfatibacillum alkenivorans DSM 16219 TaxID=1121393 RepID=A0A1M6I4A9_9BACT|nr:branched-chain amino acid ABC transporter permease [Desulfatibacillum alkenivorans]SHJ29210.1 branched-chain amino acid transport system permease protein [Desulfatibacillum alkenivorans DSM 16219]